MTHVLHVLPHPGGGGETYVDLLGGIAGYTHERAYLSGTRSPLLAGPGILAGLARAARTPADIVHGHGDVASVLGLAALAGRPLVISSHGLHMLRRVRPPVRGLFVAGLSRAIGRSTRTICESLAERDELAAVGPADRLVVIPNGIAPRRVGDRRLLRAELGIDDDVVLGVFVGQLESRKEPLLAIEAAERARAEGTPFVLAVAGDGPQSEEVRSHAGPAVRPLGFRTDLEDIFAAADIYVAPSRREGVSYALLEAMGSGLVPVVADGPGSPEVVGDAGIVVRAGDLAGFTLALRRLSGDAGLRGDLGRRAGRRVLDDYGLERFLRDTRAAYDEALRAPGRGAGGGPA
ncbi:MAG TPA: glycosyltransferase family 4 protein [Solirubrobacteraceae bacterium]